MSDVATLIVRLAHDVGKYVARTARNLPDGTVPDTLIRMLLDDLYALDGRRRASEVFAEKVLPLRRLREDPRLRRCQVLLEEIDALEASVRAAEGSSIRRAAAAAIEVDAILRALASELGR